MLTRGDFLSLNFVKKEDFTGSFQGMRFMLHQEETEEEKKLKVYLWGEPFGFEATPEEKKISQLFPFSEEGLVEAINWMNENYERIRYKKTSRELYLYSLFYINLKPSDLQLWINEKLFWKHNFCDTRPLL